MREKSLVVFAALSLASGTAHASRAEYFRPADLVVMADVIVHGRVRHYGAAPGEMDIARVRVDVEGVLKGARPSRTVEVRYRCPRIGSQWGPPLDSSSLLLRPGQRYVFYLVARRPGEAFHWLVERTDGAAPDTPALRAELVKLAKRSAAGWRSDPRGVRTLLLAPVDPVALGSPLDLRVLVQVTGTQPITYRRVDWPLKTMSWTELEVRRAGRRVAHRSIPWLKRAERDAYFQRHGVRYQRSLQPWEVVTVHLSRVSTAVMGWGYKERLGFRYYPMSVPGRYVIRARLRRVLSGLAVVETAPAEITVTSARRAPR